MKKISGLVVCLLFIVTLGFAQSVKIIYNGSILNSNDSISLSGAPADLFATPLVLKNISTNTVLVKVKKIVHYAVNGSDVSFCFAGNCFDPSIFVSPTIATILTNQNDSSFIADYSANGHGGIAAVSFVFFNMNDVNDSVSVKIKYSTSLAVNEISKDDIYFSNAYPNPASSSVSFAYTLPKQTTTAKIMIRNILGATVAEVELNDASGKKAINVSELREGIYFYSLTVNDKILYTKKMLVKH